MILKPLFSLSLSLSLSLCVSLFPSFLSLQPSLFFSPLPSPVFRPRSLRCFIPQRKGAKMFLIKKQMAAAPYWALCRGQADGRLHARSREQAQAPPPTTTTTPNRPLLNNRWLLVALTGPWPKCCIVHRYCCHLYSKQGARCYASSSRPGKSVALCTKTVPVQRGRSQDRCSPRGEHSLV